MEKKKEKKKLILNLQKRQRKIWRIYISEFPQLILKKLE